MESNSQNLFWIVDHEELCWAPGKFVRDAGNEIHVQCIDDDQYYSIEKPVLEVHPSCLEGVSDLLMLGDFNEGALLHTIRQRFKQQNIFTSIGTPILISVNPFQKLKIFTTFIARKYRKYSNAVRAGNENSVEKPQPHLFMVAEDSFQDMLMYKKNQCIIISGESGAGKTEATKIVLKYLAQANTNFVSEKDMDMMDVKAYIGEDKHSIERQVLDSNPLLEAFGNAKTNRNNNSSRFGKFIRVNFEPSGKIHSATIINYLLEKSRIVFQQTNERNYHIFYQIMASQSIKEQYKLGDIDSYYYLNQSGVFTVNGIDDGEDFKITLDCMKNIGFSDEEINYVLDIIVGVLLLGEVNFDKVAKAGVGDISQIVPESMPLVEQICELLQLDLHKLIKCLTMRTLQVGKEVIESNQQREESYNSRDAMAKSVYGNLFNWIVQRINQSISEKMNAQSSKNQKFIGILDIFGFEIFEANSFEQLCINYANEVLQQHFNHHMFNLEQEEYKQENIQWSQIKFVDNQQCIDLIESIQKPSVFKLLEEETMMKSTDLKLLRKMNDMLTVNKSFKRPNRFDCAEFIICHYAGEVEYKVSSFIEKNKDQVGDLIRDTLSQSKSQLQELMKILNESSPRYIRCIKPNHQFSPIIFDSVEVCKQLRCAGMLEAIRIRKAGYAIRVTQDDFAKRYRAVLGKKKINQLIKSSDNSQNLNKTLCEMIFKEVQQYAQNKKILDPEMKMWQVGVTKIFMKEDVRTALESAMGLAVLDQAKQIQKLFRGFKARKLFRKMLNADKIIKRHIKKYVIRRRFRKVVQKFIHNMKIRIVKIQKLFKKIYRKKQILLEINKRIIIKKDKERAEQLRKAELERVRQIQEQQKQNQQQQQQNSQQNNSLTSIRDGDNNQETKNQTNNNQQQQLLQQNRFQSNIDKLTTSSSIDYYQDLSTMESLKKQLKQMSEENDSLKQQNKQLKSEGEEKDRKIKELNIRLDISRKQQQNTSGSGQKTSANDFESLLNNQDLSFITSIDEKGNTLLNRGSVKGFQIPHQNVGQSSINEALEQKEEEIQSLKNKLEIVQMEATFKDSQFEQLKEENEQLGEKAKKWRTNLDQEIEKNSKTVQNLTQQVKDLQEKNYRLQVESNQRSMENEKRVFKDQSEEIKRLESQIREKSDQLDELELESFNMKQKHSEEIAKLTYDLEFIKKKYRELESEQQEFMIKYDRLEEKYIEKDEMMKRYEEENLSLGETCKILQNQLEDFGDNQNSMIGQMNNERQFSSQTQNKLKELNREIDRLKSALGIKEAENKILKEQLDREKKKRKEAEDDMDEKIEMNQELKKQVSNLESQLLFGGNSTNEERIEFEKQKMREKLEELLTQQVLDQEQIETLNRENEFYNQIITLFLTIQKVSDKEKKYCYMMASETDILKKSQLMEAISQCGDKAKQLDDKLRKILRQVRKNQ
eukprot:403347970